MGRGEQNAVFVGNYDLSWSSRDVQDLFDRMVGPVERVDMKDNYSFVTFREPGDAIRAEKELHEYDTGKHRLRVELAKGNNQKRIVEASCPVVFVVNFDKMSTREEDIEGFFRGYPVEHIEMWRGGKGIEAKNYCFVTLKDIETAREAIKNLDGKYIGDRQVTVEPKAGSRERRGRRRDSRDRNRRDSRDRRGGGGRSDYASLPERRERRRDDREYGRGYGRRDSRDRDGRDYGRDERQERRNDRDRDRDRDRDFRRDSRDRDYGRERERERRDAAGYGRRYAEDDRRGGR